MSQEFYQAMAVLPTMKRKNYKSRSEHLEAIVELVKEVSDSDASDMKFNVLKNEIEERYGYEFGEYAELAGFSFKAVSQ